MKVYAEYNYGGWAEVRKTAPLRASGGNLGGGTESIVVEDMVYPLEGNGCRESHHGPGYNESNKMYTLNTVEHHTVAQLSTGGVQGMDDNNVQSNNVVRQQYAVRRLTPLECERLQGLPDNFTLIDDKSCSDSARYKAIGNGMAQPVADWIIKRIVEEVDGYADKENEERETTKQTKQG